MDKIDIDIPEYKLELLPVGEQSKAERHFSEYCWDKLGTRFKIGGKPDFIQESDIPECPNCRKKMKFYAQLDTIGEKYDIGDSGLIYVFFCFDCCETKSIVQSY